MGGNRRETWEATSQASIQWRKSAGDGTPFLVIQAISKKSILRLTSISRLEKATWKIGTGAPPRIAVHQSADFPPFARDARSRARVGLGMLLATSGMSARLTPCW